MGRGEKNGKGTIHNIPGVGKGHNSKQKLVVGTDILRTAPTTVDTMYVNNVEGWRKRQKKRHTKHKRSMEKQHAEGTPKVKAGNGINIEKAQQLHDIDSRILLDTGLCRGCKSNKARSGSARQVSRHRQIRKPF